MSLSLKTVFFTLIALLPPISKGYARVFSFVFQHLIKFYWYKCNKLHIIIITFVTWKVLVILLKPSIPDAIKNQRIVKVAKEENKSWMKNPITIHSSPHTNTKQNVKQK